jgi:hypothetical protein
MTSDALPHPGGRLPQCCAAGQSPAEVPPGRARRARPMPSPTSCPQARLQRSSHRRGSHHVQRKAITDPATSRRMRVDALPADAGGVCRDGPGRATRHQRSDLFDRNGCPHAADTTDSRRPWGHATRVKVVCQTGITWTMVPMLAKSAEFRVIRTVPSSAAEIGAEVGGDRGEHQVDPAWSRVATRLPHGRGNGPGTAARRTGRERGAGRIRSAPLGNAPRGRRRRVDRRGAGRRRVR